jgi:hypothetical protein
VDRARRAGEIVDLIDFDIEWEGDIVAQQFEMRVIDHRHQIVARTSEKIIGADDSVALLEQTLAQKGSEEAGPPGH